MLLSDTMLSALNPILLLTKGRVKMRKILSMLLAVIMVLSCSSLSVMASANPKNSTDKMTFDEYVVYLTEIATTEA